MNNWSIRAPKPWSIAFTCQSDNPECQPALIVTHKVLLQSFESVRAELTQIGDRWTGTLHHLPSDQTIDVDKIRRNWCPTSLALLADGQGSVLVSDIAMIDSQGQAVIGNGSFARGSQAWFFTCDDHLIWRAKNCWLHLLVETGWTWLIALG